MAKLSSISFVSFSAILLYMLEAFLFLRQGEILPHMRLHENTCYKVI